jgi:hypothetical protein
MAHMPSVAQKVQDLMSRLVLGAAFWRFSLSRRIGAEGPVQTCSHRIVPEQHLHAQPCLA